MARYDTYSRMVTMSREQQEDLGDDWRSMWERAKSRAVEPFKRERHGLTFSKINVGVEDDDQRRTTGDLQVYIYARLYHANGEHDDHEPDDGTPEPVGDPSIPCGDPGCRICGNTCGGKQ